MKRVDREMARLARRYGMTVRRTTRGHFQFLSGDRVMVTASGTPSDGRALRNLTADLRRASITSSERHHQNDR